MHSYAFEKPVPLNQRVQGSSPCAPTIEIKDLAEITRGHATQKSRLGIWETSGAFLLEGMFGATVWCSYFAGSPRSPSAGLRPLVGTLTVRFTLPMTPFNLAQPNPFPLVLMVLIKRDGPAAGAVARNQTAAGSPANLAQPISWIVLGVATEPALQLNPGALSDAARRWPAPAPMPLNQHR